MSSKSSLIKKISVVLGIAALLALIGFAFYYQDWQYSLPAQKPAAFRTVPIGTTVLPAKASGPAILYHFSGTGCPCSAFVVPQVRALAQKHKGRLKVVFVEEDLGEEPEGLPDELEGFAEYRRDKGGKLAKELGVYATPVGALVGADGKVYFTGNYNRSRYCQDPRTEYMRIAIDSLMAGRPSAHIEAPLVKGCAIFEGIETLALEAK